MLIDCGVWDGDAATMTQMKRVVENIRAATDDHLSVLTCTHEHWDHNSGFNQHRDIFDKKMTIDHVWLAWTENLKDQLARDLKAEYEARRKKLARAIARLAAADRDMGAAAEALAIVDGVMRAAGVKANPADAMKWIRDRANQDPKSFLMPGDVRDVPGAATSARAFVLGPPYSRSLLRKNLPTKKQQEEGDVYHDDDAFHLRFANRLADDAFFAAVEHVDKSPEQIAALVGEDLDEYQLGLPFDLAHQVALKVARRHDLVAGYLRNGDAWRRIDDDWLNTAAQIALWMQSSTNNTSLVLAIELLPARKVLLMTADAQVGNWISWADVKFKPPHDNVSVDDLLARTVLYKVGHHGSHNATLRKNGLEKMTSDELAAMIPVNRKSVDAKKWAMPYPPMYRALRRQTKGRVIRADEGVMPKLASTPAATWNRFVGEVEKDSSYFQLRCHHG
jgi:hypothetical protein